jgi:hypothetical protein
VYEQQLAADAALFSAQTALAASGSGAPAPPPPPAPVLVPVADPSGRAPFLLVPLRGEGVFEAPPGVPAEQPPAPPPRLAAMGGAVASRFAELAAARAAPGSGRFL